MVQMWTAGSVARYIDGMPEWISRIGLNDLFASNTILDWIVLFGAILAGVVVGSIVSAILRRSGRKLADHQRIARSHTVGGAAGPSAMLIFAVGLRLGLFGFRMSPALSGFSIRITTFLVYYALFWYAFNVVGIIEPLLRRITGKTATAMDDSVVPLIRKTTRIFLVIVGFLLIAQNVFQQDIAAWLAGLGIAGLAVSLSAQDSIRNLFGSITILFDRPFVAGDRIVFAGFDGPVEEIGFRSIRIRTLDGHLVTVPNSKVVNEAVQNISARPYIKRVMNITVTYDTPREKLVRAVELIRGIFEEEGIREPIHATIGKVEYPPRVYFSEFNPDSLNIVVIYWYVPPVYWDYLDHGQRVNLRIMEEFEREGIEFAFPTQTIHLAGK